MMKRSQDHLEYSNMEDDKVPVEADEIITKFTEKKKKKSKLSLGKLKIALKAKEAMSRKVRKAGTTVSESFSRLVARLSSSGDTSTEQTVRAVVVVIIVLVAALETLVAAVAVAATIGGFVLGAVFVGRRWDDDSNCSCKSHQWSGQRRQDRHRSSGDQY